MLIKTKNFELADMDIAIAMEQDKKHMYDFDVGESKRNKVIIKEPLEGNWLLTLA